MSIIILETKYSGAAFKAIFHTLILISNAFIILMSQALFLCALQGIFLKEIDTGHLFYLPRV